MQGIYLNVSLYIYFRSLYIYIYMHASLPLSTYVYIYIYNIYLLPTCCGVRPSTAGFGSNNNCVRSHPPMEQQRRSRSRSVGRKPVVQPPPAAPPPAPVYALCRKRCHEGPPACACGTPGHPRARCIFVAGHRRVPNHMCGTCFDWLHSAADGAYGPYMAPDYLAGNLYEGAK